MMDVYEAIEGKEKVYISGRMTGVEDFNYPLFNSVAQKLEDRGYIALNPASNFNGRTDLPKCVYMRKDVEMLLEADWILMLPKWELSAGARLEWDIAQQLSIPQLHTDAYLLECKN